MTSTPAYGSLGCVGVIVPPANVTVEPEMVDVMPRGLSVIGTRLPGRVSKETSIGLRERFIGYNRVLASVADSFGGASLSALGLACTGSCYLDGPGGDEKLCADLRAGGTQHVVTAAHALKELIEALGKRRIGLVTPYPAWVTELAIKYWQASGFEVVHALELPGVVSIYDVDTDAVVTTAREMMRTGADMILLSGTGVPTVPAVGILSQTATVPVISSNLALAWWMLRALGIGLHESPSPALHALAKWLPKTYRPNPVRRGTMPVPGARNDEMSDAEALALLDSFAQAYNRHDVDDIMAHMTDDCEFISYFGPDICGEKFVGRDKVRQRVAAGLADFPGARWDIIGHFVSGDRGVSEWILRGTRRGTTEYLERQGLDIFTFRNGKIRIKNTYQKWRQPR